MNIYENEALEQKLQEITDQMGEFILDVILMSLKKVNSENLIFQEFNDVRLQVKKEDIHVTKGV